jgi:Lon protease-like protein
VDRPVFALHAVVFPGQPLALRVFEERYLHMMEDVLPEGAFVVVAIRLGQEVGGPYEAHRVGVTVSVQDYDYDADEAVYHLYTTGRERVALVQPTATDPYPRWQVEPYPDEGGAGTDAVESARRAFAAYLRATGEDDATPAIPHEPVAASFAMAAAAPGLPVDRQSLLEIPGAGARLAALERLYRREASLVRVLGAGVGGAGVNVNPN